MTSAAFDRWVDAVRTAVAGIAVAAGLFVLLRVPVIASFRYALILLAALEVLSSGRRMLGGGPWVREAITLAIKIAILAGGYVALGP